MVLIFISLFAEVFVNSRALVVRYHGSFYFPTYGEMIPGTTFGLDYDYETNYRELKQRVAENRLSGQKFGRFCSHASGSLQRLRK